VLRIALVLGVLVAGISRTDGSQQRNPGTGRCFLAHSSMTTQPPQLQVVGTEAWLFCVDAQSSAGRMLDAPRATALRDVTVSDAGRLAFRSAELLGLGRFYQFEGTVNKGVVAGQLEYRWSYSERVAQTWRLAGAEIDSTSASRPASEAERWSSFRTSPATGDEYGIDVEIFATSLGPLGLITFYEGGPWSEYVGAPFLATSIKRTGGEISFQIGISGGLKGYRLRPVSGTTRMHLFNERGDDYGELPRVPSLLDQLRR